MLTPSKIANIANIHLVWVLFGTWVVYGYRDVFPLGTFTLQPLDLHEGWLMWTKLAVLTFAAVIVPAFIPTRYVPFDPKVRPNLIVGYLVPESTLVPHRTQLQTSTPNRQPPGFRLFPSLSRTMSSSRPLASHIFPLNNFLPWLTMIGRLILSRGVSPYVFTYCIYAMCGLRFNHSQFLDPLSGTVKRHVFFGFLRVFRREYIIMCSLLVLRVSALCEV